MSDLTDKLAVETRLQIYGYLLQCERPIHQVCDNHCFWYSNRHVIDTSILRANRIVCQEARSALFDLNTVKIPHDSLCALELPVKLAARGLSLARRVTLRTSQYPSTHTGCNTCQINAETLLGIIAVMPQLQSLDLHLCWKSGLIITLFDRLAQKAQVADLTMTEIGFVEATTKSGVRITIKHIQMNGSWRYHETSGRHTADTIPIDNGFHGHLVSGNMPVSEVYRCKMLREQSQLDTSQLAILEGHLNDFHELFPACTNKTIDSVEFWTYLCEICQRGSK